MFLYGQLTWSHWGCLIWSEHFYLWITQRRTTITFINLHLARNAIHPVWCHVCLKGWCLPSKPVENLYNRWPPSDDVLCISTQSCDRKPFHLHGPSLPQDTHFSHLPHTESPHAAKVKGWEMTCHFQTTTLFNQVITKLFKILFTGL